MADTDKLAHGDRQFVARLLANAPKLAAGTLLAGFAARLNRDRDAVQAAIDLPWATSPVEGQVNRIETIKRSMYGRAGSQLLRAYVLYAA